MFHFFVLFFFSGNFVPRRGPLLFDRCAPNRCDSLPDTRRFISDQWRDAFSRTKRERERERERAHSRLLVQVIVVVVVVEPFAEPPLSRWLNKRRFQRNFLMKPVETVSILANRLTVCFSNLVMARNEALIAKENDAIELESSWNTVKTHSNPIRIDFWDGYFKKIGRNRLSAVETNSPTMVTKCAAVLFVFLVPLSLRSLARLVRQ